MGISGHIAVVTGGTSGLGAAIARHFAQQGARVVITGRDQDRGQSLVEEVAASGGEAAFVAADLADENCGVAVRDGAEAAFGAPEILINNAGTFFHSPVADVTLEHFDRAITINLRGPFLITQALLPGMVEGNFGRVIFVSSSGASYGLAMTPMYASTKAALKGLMVSMVPEYGLAGITFNTIEPGLIATPLTSNMVGTPELDERFIPHQPTGRIGIPLDAAHAALMFADDDAGHITGQSILLDGGNTRTAKHSQTAIPSPKGSYGDFAED